MDPLETYSPTWGQPEAPAGTVNRKNGREATVDMSEIENGDRVSGILFLNML
jgi:hypothetical protein